jgi:hypothetical protein
MDDGYNVAMRQQQREQQIVPQELLDSVKQQAYERSANEGKIVELGTLSGGKHEHLWTGTISLARRLQSRELLEDEVQQRVSKIGNFYVPTTPGAAKRCIDGSSLQGYDDANPRLYGRGLGPQLQGGSFGEAVALRMWNGIPNTATVNFLADLQYVTERPSKYRPGDHTDDRADGTKTGCGQYDGQPRKLPRYNEPESAQVMADTADTILSLVNISSQKAAFSRLQKTAAELQRMDYFVGAKEALARLRELNPNGVETLVRPHNEVSLTLNFVADTTFHRDHYNAGTNSRIQNFGLDAWVPLAEHGEAGYALVVDAVATAMDLTDGSLRLYARLPR